MDWNYLLCNWIHWSSFPFQDSYPRLNPEPKFSMQVVKRELSFQFMSIPTKLKKLFFLFFKVFFSKTVWSNDTHVTCERKNDKIIHLKFLTESIDPLKNANCRHNLFQNFVKNVHYYALLFAGNHMAREFECSIIWRTLSAHSTHRCPCPALVLRIHYAMFSHE